MSAAEQPLVAQKYRVICELGRGGVGVVYEAEHTWTGRHVAVKVLSPSHGVDEASAQRFLREARSSARLIHPNVVPIFDAGVDDDGSLFLVQELLRGEDLQSRLDREVFLSLDDTLATLGPIMDALSAAHAAGIVHRDVKPSNIFLSRVEGAVVPRLIDFGLAMSSDPQSHRVTGVGVAVGTPTYMSPEQLASSHDVDLRTDIWALGVLVYECLSGRLPFDAPHLGALAISIAHSEPPPLETVVPGLLPGVAACVARALQKRPSDRFRTVREMREALEAAVEPARRSERPIALHAIDSDADIVLDVEIEQVEEVQAVEDAWAIAQIAELDRQAARAAPSSGPRTPASTDTGGHFRRGPMRAALAHGIRTLRLGIAGVGGALADPSIIASVEAAVGTPTVALSYATYEDLLVAMREQALELAWMSPIAFVLAAEERLVRGGVTAERGGRSTYVSALVGHRGRVARLDAATLHGKRAAWVDRWSAAGFLMPRRVLRSAGLDPDRLLAAQTLVGSYGAVTECLALGTADVGGLFAWRGQDGMVEHTALPPELAVLAVSDPIPSDVLCFGAGVPTELSDALLTGLLAASPGAAHGGAMLAALSAERFVRLDERAYADLARYVREDPAPRVGAPIVGLDWDE